MTIADENINHLEHKKFDKSATSDSFVVRTLAELPAGTKLILRKDETTPNRVIFGWALPGTAQTDAAWLIFAEDDLASMFEKTFAEKNGEPVADFVHKWSDRDSILPGQAFVNQFSVSFSGLSNSNASVPDADDIDFDNTDGFSMSLWCKATTGAGGATLFQKATSTAGNNGYYYYSDSAGRMLFEFRGTGTGDRIRVRSIAFSGAADGEWHHMMVTKASGSTAAASVKIYIDGVEETLTVMNDTLSGTTTSAASLFVASNVGGASRFDGHIDEFSIWNAELTPAEVTEVYNSNSGVIDLQNGSGQIASALAAWWRFGDGSFVAIPDIPDEEGTNDMTTGSAISSGDVESEVPP